MIAHITGMLLHHDAHSLVLDVNGVGYKVFVREDLLESLTPKETGEPLSLFTHLAVRESALDLYGFAEEEELHFFELLLTVSGIGPKSALSILNIAPVAALTEAIASNDSTYLTKVSGIGSKSAQKIVLELQGKIGAMDNDVSGVRAQDVDTLEALRALGYSASEIREVLKSLPEDTKTSNERIKEALKLLGK